MKKNNSTILLFSLLAVAVILSAQSVAALPLNPTAPVLGESGRFIILASQTVTTTPGSNIVNGDIGVMDQARSYTAVGFTTGAPPGTLVELTNGISYAKDDSNPLPYANPLHYSTSVIGAPWTATAAMLTQSKTDLGIAFNYLAADPNPTAPTQVLPTELGGLTLTRGVYKTALGVTIQSGNLTLDAQGDSNSVWIFNIGGTLTTGDISTGSSIVLKNGAQAKNIYWKTDGKTVIGTNTFFNGNVFAWTQVNALTGAHVTGRLFASTDQVTLQSNDILLLSRPTAPVLTTIILTPADSNFTVGETQQFNASGFDQFNESISSSINYTTSDLSVATVNASGFVTAIASGSVKIIAFSGNINSSSSNAEIISTSAPTPSSTDSGSSSHSGGGGGSCTTQWNCTSWSSCANNAQTRECTYNSGWCTPTTTKPSQSQVCTTAVTTTDGTADNQSAKPAVSGVSGNNGITGAITGTSAPVSLTGIIIMILVGLGIIGTLVYRKFNKK